MFYPTLLLVNSKGEIIYEPSLGIFQPDVDGKPAAVEQLREQGELVKAFLTTPAEEFFTAEWFEFIKKSGLSLDTQVFDAAVAMKDELIARFGEKDVMRMLRRPIGSAAANNVYGLKGKRIVDKKLNEEIRKYAYLLDEEERRHTLDNLEKKENR